MINKNKLSLKKLQEQLDELKQNKSNIKLNISPNIEVRKSSLILGYLLSWGLLFISKIPLFNKVYRLLKWYYGRTTLWATLVLIRKVFIVINAIIGVLAVFTLTGFGAENLLAGFVGMGYNYIEIISNLTKRLFNWFFDLFDYKVVPNIPNNKPNLWSGGHNSPLNSIGWFSKPMVNESLFNLDQLTVGKGWNPSPVQSNSYFGDWTTWLWIIGGIALSATLFCSGLMAYSYYLSTPDTDLPNSNIFNRWGVELFGHFNELRDQITSRLNPMTWFNNIRTRLFGDTAPNAEEVFRFRQNNLNTYDNRFYPFTNNDPFKPWFHRWRISIFGETETEMGQRIFDRDIALRLACEILDKKPGLIPSGLQTPWGLGLGLHLDPTLWPDWVNHMRTEEILRRLPQTPVHMPNYFADFFANPNAGPSGNYSPGSIRGTLVQNYPQMLENLGTAEDWSNQTDNANPIPQILINDVPVEKIKND